MRTSRLIGVAAVAAVAFGLAACSSDAPTSTEDPDDPTATEELADGQFPVTIEHVYGTTTIAEQPVNIASVAWSNHEVPLALGIVPVGFSKATWGDDDDNGVLPWVEDALAELGAEIPVLFDETDGIDYEAVADTDPDVILAAYSGLSEEEYDTLSRIAPVVAYPEVAWGTSVEDTIRLNSAAIGLAASGEALIEDLHERIDSALAENSALEGKRVLFSYLDVNDLSQIGFYTSLDTRPGFLEGIGLPAPSIVAEASAGTDAFYTQVSSEEVERFEDVDVFVTYGDDSLVAVLQADPLLSQIPAIAAGNVAILENDTPLAASANPSPLSIPWGIGDYFALLAAASG